MSGNGWCTHPDRQVSSDVRILVRKAELACRNAWGSDLWEDASLPAESPAARSGNSRDEHVHMPQPLAPVSYDDEVTSVVSADQHQASRAEPMDDEVVDQSVIQFNDEYPDEEQDERRNLLYRDSRNAIERARQRHLQRRQQPVMDEEAEDVAEDIVLSEGEESQESIAASLEKPVFEPDDFVEEESPATTPKVDEHDDALLSEGIRTESPRARRLRRFREDRNLPKEPTVAKNEPDPDDVELVLPPSAAPERGRFDSIPEISADFELPLLRRSSSATQRENHATHDGVSEEEESYDRALKRAHALNAASRAEQNVRQRRESSTTAIREEQAPALAQREPTSMPDLPGEDEEFAAPTSEESPSAGHSAPATPAPRQRINMERIRPQERRPQRQPPLQPSSPPSQERQERPAQDPRRSWWRGSRAARAAELAANEHEPVDGVSGDLVVAADPAEIHLPDVAEPRTEAPIQVEPAAPERVTFDLKREEDFESFRDRLFTSAPAQEDGSASTHQRSPINVSRRPITPAARERYRAEREPARVERREAMPEGVRPERREARQQRTAPFPQPQRHLRHIEPEELLDQPEDGWYEPEPVPHFDVRTLIEPDTELLDMTIEIAPKVERACLTCRSYRPSEQPGRGWCTNSWAFTHRQMVNETDLACDSTIGCWWLPADEEVWLTELDVAEEATPRIDRLIAHLHPERRAVGN